jgi:Gnt-I system low-affinity gluconate transporter
MTELQLLGATLAGIALLLYLIIGLKLHAFVALLIGSLVIGVGAGMPFSAVLESLTNGVGSTLASIAVVIGLGAMFGQMLDVCGGAHALADSLVTKLGERSAQWSVLAVGFIVAIPVFFDVAFIVLVSVVYGLARRTQRPVVYFALPLLAGLAVAHAFVPPTPGPIAVAAVLGADLGWVILLGVAIGLPAAVVGGPMYARWIAQSVESGVPDYMSRSRPDAARAMPSVSVIAALIATPLVLIIANTVATAALPEGLPRNVLTFVGHPIVALLFVCLLSFWLLGWRAGFSPAEIQSTAAKALEPAGLVILVTGAGGMLKQVLIDSGVGDLLADAMHHSSLPVLIFAYATAASLRLMQGSATVAMLTAAGLVASLLGDAHSSEPRLALIVIAIAAGATIASHVNDSGFWLVNRYLGLSVADTLKTWTVTTTLISVVSIGLVLILGSLL